ncbi:MAG: hypothetical protein A2W90_17705 [Bacteroidetes bacterium GWF2_42_66]|nr:MAG: hypothetical protein A2W92_16640 [Bacteroidetes bacterium GWA2_42_15]OFX98092.1 MAG: hypothetical protein A2W89_09195 [Bacteroidetes bacterium GWE2_42_39]OFY42476.1 MAG: hypothetical protein A2W90_17705 [Bacteroidetes bacterium GWF2_42_66]HBL74188.1 hypothetical protein [Prolixibacteraceae bacterium]HCR91673.1 hypothetical protein [Prolixibacteraceae bacterium]
MKPEHTNIHESIRAGSLIGKYLTGKESAKEKAQLKDWLNEDARHQQLFNTLKKNGNIADAMEEFGVHDKEQAWKRYTERLAALSLRKMLFRWKVAAVFFFLVACTGILAYINSGWNSLPGNESYTTVSTNNGQNSRIILPDSSVVWVNSGTTLSYNTNFAAKNRHIRLSGQAFFKVARNEEMPLTVTCNDLQVKVLGTEFDVSAYPEDQNISVVLESGSVKLLHANDKSFGYTLSPGEKAEFNVARGNLSVNKVNSYNYTSWKDGILIFEDAPMRDVIEKLERWYDINIEVKNENVYKLVFNATIVNESMGDIFDLIKFSCAVNYKIIPSDKPEVPVQVILSN